MNGYSQGVAVCHAVACAPDQPLGVDFATTVELLRKDIDGLRSRLGPILKPIPCGANMKPDTPRSQLRQTLDCLRLAIGELRDLNDAIDL